MSKYGFKSLEEVVINDVPNATLLETLEVLSYRLNLDFSMKITRYNQDNKDVDLKLGENEFFFVEPVITFLQGICYKLATKFQVNNERVTIVDFHIQLKSGETNRDQPSHFVVYLTSPTATLNIAANIWPQYLPGKVKVPFNSGKISIFQFDKVIEYTFKNGVQNTSECMKQVISKSDCSINECCHISGCSLPICNSTNKFDSLHGNIKLFKECFLQKHSLAYLPRFGGIPCV